MSYNVSIWTNTGFNVNNIPDSPALLGQGTSVQAVEIMQERYLSSIKISSVWNTVKDVDYCKVGDMYYVVTGVSMLATDVAELSLVPDFISSLGGVTQLTILDGITERCHLPNSIDGDKDDPLLAPHDALELDYEVLLSGAASVQGESSKFTVIETAIDVNGTTAYPKAVKYKKGITALSEETVYIPYQNGLGKRQKTEFISPIVVGAGVTEHNAKNRRDTTLELVDADDDVYRLTAGGQVSTNIPDQDGETHKLGNSMIDYPDADDPSTKHYKYSIIDYNAAYVSFIRGAGIESCIVNKVEYPNDKVFVEECYYAPSPNWSDLLYEDEYKEEIKKELPEVFSEDILVEASITKIKGCDKFQNSTIKYKYTNANNDILDFSDYTPYGLLTAAGNKIESIPKNLVSDIHSVTANDAPKVRCLADPNPDGAPYYAYKDYMGDSSVIGFLSRAAKGMNWKTVPIVYTEKSGWITDVMSKKTTEDITTNQYLASQAQTIAGSAASAAFAGAPLVTYSSQQAGREGYVWSPEAGYMGTWTQYGVPKTSRQTMYGTPQALGALNHIVGGISQAVYNDMNYRQQMYSAGMNYALSRVSSPTLSFPYNSEPARLATDNGVINYRLKYSARDIARIDKLITMYGVKTTRALESSMFTSRRYFNYIACDNVTLTGHSKWMDEGAALQLKGGVRIWHVKPDPAKFLTENI